MTGVFVKYHKVTQDAFSRLAPVFRESNIEIVDMDLSKMGSQIDIIPYQTIKNYLDSVYPIDFILMGDIFWPTGQNICRWCEENNVKSYFLQHGQWIYMANKQNIKFHPSFSLVFGDNIKNTIESWISQWPLWKKSTVVSAGSPRYDGAKGQDGDYVYLSPPVIEEEKGLNQKIDQSAYRILSLISGIDNKFNIYIHPHYREMKVDILKRLFKNAIFIDPEKDPLPVIANAGKVLTHRNSTVVLDAIAYHKPVVLMNIKQHKKSFFEKNYFGEFALESNKIEDIENNLRKDIKTDNDNYMDRAKPYIYLGNASRKILDLVKAV